MKKFLAELKNKEIPKIYMQIAALATMSIISLAMIMLICNASGIRHRLAYIEGNLGAIAFNHERIAKSIEKDQEDRFNLFDLFRGGMERRP
jgi:hypothetical protein